MKILSSLIAIILILSSLSSVHAAESVKVAAIFAKTGKAALDSASALDGVRFAVQTLNNQGGVLGKKLELLEFNNQSTALGSKIAAKKAVKAGVVIAFGANYSSHSLAMAPVFQKAKIPMISPYSTNPNVTLIGDYIFRICFINSFQGRVMAKFALQDLNAKTAGVLINANSQFSENLSHYFTENYQVQDGIILFKEHYLDKTS
ncbi:MAG: ABC transporter substrate-binding protein, partial [Desulfobacula sp.]|nr:ABC transporter substrate-binding protein [Desulfobacula sp.]